MLSSMSMYAGDFRFSGYFAAKSRELRFDGRLRDSVVEAAGIRMGKNYGYSHVD
jgi:hypothetical protein